MVFSLFYQIVYFPTKQKLWENKVHCYFERKLCLKAVIYFVFRSKLEPIQNNCSTGVLNLGALLLDDEFVDHHIYPQNTRQNIDPHAPSAKLCRQSPAKYGF